MTPVWYREEKKQYIQEVCNTPTFESCAHFMGLDAQFSAMSTPERVKEIARIYDYLVNNPPKKARR